MQETWVELAFQESNKLKKGRKKKRGSDRAKKTRMFALKGLMNYKAIQRKTTMVFRNRKGWENQKEEDQEQVKNLVRQNHPFGKPPFSQSLSVCNRDSYEIQGADKRWNLQIGVRPLRSVLLNPCGKKNVL